MRLLTLLLLVLSTTLTASAHISKQVIAKHPEMAIASDRLYDGENAVADPAPKGYKPFYISGVARHGSRYFLEEEFYTQYVKHLTRANDLGLLTPLGKQLLDVFTEAAALHDTHTHALTSIGYEQSRQIAHRTYKRLPQLFTKGAKIRAWSSLRPRCIMTMVAFMQGIKECNPAVIIDQNAEDESQIFLRPQAFHMPDSEKRIDREFRKRAKAHIEEWAAKQQCPKSLARIATDPARFVEKMGIDSFNFMQNIFERLNFAHNFWTSQYDLIHKIFDTDEIYLFHIFHSYRWLCYFGMVDNPYTAHYIAGARPLFDDIIARANSAIEGKNDAVADMRYTHDSFLLPLLTTLRVDGCYGKQGDVEDVCRTWRIGATMSMAGNLQLVFYRNKEGHVLVQILFNEDDVRLDFDGGNDSFYDWKELCNYIYRQLDTLDRVATGVKR